MRGTHRPAGLSSTEMSKKVRFLDMVADGNAWRTSVCVSRRRLADRHRKRTRGCDLREKKKRAGVYIGREQQAGAHPQLGHASLQDGHPRRCVLSRRFPSPAHSDVFQPVASGSPRSLRGSSTTYSSPTTTLRSKVRLCHLLSGRGADTFARNLRMLEPNRRHKLFRVSYSSEEKLWTDPSPSSSKF